MQTILYKIHTIIKFFFIRLHQEAQSRIFEKQGSTKTESVEELYNQKGTTLFLNQNIKIILLRK